ncbi:permease-like cell division protein FtsX [Psychrobacillus psychrodurans]|jgi:cell division transport system permease protein|uniref:permease-like cell division protein FtsX n=1 Tax=Psychrobacillus TaxID=1221880 RepID=UPI0008F09321|nr:permease-like cell division protein FtsX [Psychrobacillus psychrodurans]MCK1996017.1 permease-like cell division protein FtsX [Psychrobacillus psychrodurans]MCZ8539253.1 permease-like cell division protein FtsX [Psychrobacillus psychrodurans]SFM34972.1 cell division transport system permease protein [Psychrobacillus psychrodurans]
MKGRTLGRHFRESLKSISRNGWMTFASVSAVTVTLLLVGVFVMIMMNLNKIADDLEKDVEIKVYVELTADEASITKLEQEIKETAGVAEVKYSPKGDELSKLVVDFGEDLRLYDQQNPLHNVFYAKATNPQETEAVAKKLDRLDNTFEVKYGEGKIENLFSFLNTGRNVGLVLILALLFTAMFLISNTIRITIVARRRDIEIMKLVGATNWFIRIPFILEGMWLGILGSIVPITLVTVLYYNISNLLAPKLKQGKLFELLDFSPFIYQVNGLILLMGVLIGVWGSFMSVRKFLRV